MTNFMKGMGGHQKKTPIFEPDDTDRNDDWLTPPEIVRELGPFDTDPCASCSQVHEPGTRRNPPLASVRYCKCMDGLGREWSGLVWCNPPYGAGIGRWMARLARHGDGIALVFARTDTAWFQEYVLRKAQGVFFVAQRIRFHRPDGTVGKYTGGAPSCFAAYGHEAEGRLQRLRMKGRYVNLRG